MTNFTDHEIERAQRQRQDEKPEQPSQKQHEDCFVYLNLLRQLHQRGIYKGFGDVQRHYLTYSDLAAASKLAMAILEATQGKREQRRESLAERRPVVDSWRVGE